MSFLYTAQCVECGAGFAAEASGELDPAAVTMFWRLRGGHICDSCKQARAEAARIQDERLAAAREIRHRADWLQRAGVPKRYLDRGFEAFDGEFDGRRHLRTWRECRDWAGGFDLWRPEASTSVVLWSVPASVGTGKTHLAAAMLQEVLQRAPLHRPDHVPVMADHPTLGRIDIAEQERPAPQRPALFTTAPAALQRISASRRWAGPDDRHETEQEVLEDFAMVPLLVLDDVGKERERYDQREFYYECINSRYCNGRPLIVTANVPPDHLADVIGTAAASRLSEMAAGWMFDMTGRDYRDEESRRRLEGSTQ